MKIPINLFTSCYNFYVVYSNNIDNQFISFFVEISNLLAVIYFIYLTYNFVFKLLKKIELSLAILEIIDFIVLK